MAQESNVGSVPEGTETEEWRVMSAKVAWALWKSKEAPRSDWDANAPKYRAQTRYVLRQIAAEGLHLRWVENHQVMDLKSEPWRQASARFAWLLWLRDRRDLLPADESVEAMVWKFVADDERRRVRSVVEGLQSEGVAFLV